MTLSAGEERELRALQRRKQRERSGRFLAEGVRVVEDLLASPLTVHWAVTAPSLEGTERGRELAAGLDRRGIRRRGIGDADFALLAATEHPQGVLAVAEAPSWRLDDLRPTEEREVVLVLDAVQDPGNFGTLVRSAEALGARGVIALPGTVDPWNPKSIRAAVGSSFRLPVVAASWDEAAAWLRENRFRTLAAEMGGAEPPRDLARAALVVGNEGAGLSAEVLAGVDGVVGVPLRGRAESLNVAAAAAILLYELTR
ncbi:MAG TPA: RNA methyltransferase [Longimicrobiaceae bacterium]|nr:RNA methyltransferase [Longimicrobiaceae bacterium]